MSTLLVDFFIRNDAPRLLFDFEKKREGGFATYLPNNGEIGFRSDIYSPEDLEHPFIQYVFQAFGKPEITFVQEKEVSSWHDARVVSPHYFPHIVRQAQLIGSGVQNMYYQLNDKEYFQELVQEILGDSYTTHPYIVDAGEEIDKVTSIVKQLQNDYAGNIVLRIPDARITEGGGDGVRFIKTDTDVEKALRSVKHAIENNRLATRVMIERFIPSVFSPSTTFFLGEHEIVPLSINSQILDKETFIAGTNILPDGMSPYCSELQLKGMQIAAKTQALGARGFLGIDWLMGDTFTAVEANYRETGNTIPEIWADKANNFVEGIGWAEWVHVIEIPYTRKVSSINDVLRILKDAGVLFENRETGKGFDALQCIPSYGMWEEKFDLVIFWRKGSIAQEKSFQQINTILSALHSDKRVQAPGLTL